MNIEQRIRQIAAKKIKVIITAKVRNRDGFTVKQDGESGGAHARTKKEALQMLLALLRCYKDKVWRIEPVKITPNPKHKADVPWKRKVL